MKELSNFGHREGYRVKESVFIVFEIAKIYKFDSVKKMFRMIKSLQKIALLLEENSHPLVVKM